MKIILIDGVKTASKIHTVCINDLTGMLAEYGIECTIMEIREDTVHGCTGCGKCLRAKRCIYNEQANECAALLRQADGVIVSASVYFGGLDERMKDFLDCLFHSAPDALANKPAGSLLWCRGKAGDAWISLIRYYASCNMTVVTSQDHAALSEQEYNEQNRRIIVHLAESMRAILTGNRSDMHMPERRMDFIR